MIENLIRVFALTGPASPAKCRGCGASIVWHETLTGKRMPINAGAVPRRTEREGEGKRRTILFLAAADAHWATCPKRAQFSKR